MNYLDWRYVPLRSVRALSWFWLCVISVWNWLCADAATTKAEAWDRALGLRLVKRFRR